MALPEVGRMPASISKTLLVCSLLAALSMLISHPCIGFGSIRWVYLGDDISVIMRHGKRLIGPGDIELHATPDFIYGLFCDEGDWYENRWFAIRRRDGKVYVSGRSEEIERVFRACGSKASFGLNRPGGIYRTFQSMRKELSNE